MSSVRDPILYAVPAFIVLLFVEYALLRHVKNHPELEGPPTAGPVGYERGDTRTSLTMGIVRTVIEAFWALAAIATYALIYTIAPFHFPADQWYTWVVLFFADDFIFYIYHRTHHEIRFLWGQHVLHHSSRHFNLSTALRQPWVLMTELPYLALLALMGFKPWMIITMHSFNLIYQYWIHTEVIDRMPRWYEFIFNTPSHHRVHHGANPQYLDRNYGGVLIIWDRIFRTFEPEDERVVYGLTKNIHTFNPWTVFSHEFKAIWHDVRAADSWRAKFGYAFRRPGWAPDGHDRREEEREPQIKPHV
ncbi:MAG: sterol desaturase family protein [Thermoleophilaceae bacterium]|nr:sterol desaturase family protein [Thermoleophilaceae bacterium]